ncbi:MAG: peptidylprolyl isomerase [Rudaea sp.]
MGFSLKSIVRGICLLVLANAAVAAATVDASRPVVSQGGATVTVGDVDAYMARLPAEKWAGFISSADRIESMLRDLLRTKQLALQAREMKLDQDPQVQGQLALAQDDALAKIRFDAFTKTIKVPDLGQLAKEEYLSHKDQYVVPADVTVQQVLIGTKDRSDEDAKKLAESVRTQALADLAHFEELVQKYSDDPSKASNKGMMKDATSSKYVKEFGEAAGKLSAKNPISPIVKTRFGYHILKFIDATPAKQKSFDEVKAQILDSLDKQYIVDQRKDFLNQLSNQKMTPYPDAIASLHDRYFTGTGVPVDAPAKAPAPAAAVPAKP